MNSFKDQLSKSGLDDSQTSQPATRIANRIVAETQRSAERIRSGELLADQQRDELDELAKSQVDKLTLAFQDIRSQIELRRTQIIANYRRATEKQRPLAAHLIIERSVRDSVIWSWFSGQVDKGKTLRKLVKSSNDPETIRSLLSAPACVFDEIPASLRNQAREALLQLERPDLAEKLVAEDRELARVDQVKTAAAEAIGSVCETKETDSKKHGVA